MTVRELMTRLDGLTANQYAAADKLRWLCEVEETVLREILLTHESDREITFTPYDTVDDTALLVPEPYSRLYPLYLETQIHYHNGEIGKYNNAAAAFRGALEDFRNYHNRTHMPRQQAKSLGLM